MYVFEFKTGKCGWNVANRINVFKNSHGLWTPPLQSDEIWSRLLVWSSQGRGQFWGYAIDPALHQLDNKEEFIIETWIQVYFNHNDYKMYLHFVVNINSCHKRQSLLTKIVPTSMNAATATATTVITINIRALEHLFTATASRFCECKHQLGLSKFTK